MAGMSEALMLVETAAVVPWTGGNITRMSGAGCTVDQAAFCSLHHCLTARKIKMTEKQKR